VNSDGSVTATATTQVTGLALGPLTLGSIVSTAAETLKPDGTITPSSSTKIIGASIAGLSVTIDKDELLIGGVGVGVPLSNLIQPLLGKSGDTLTFQDVKTTKGTVIAPDILLTIPFKDPLGKGTYTLTIGGTSVSMQGSAAPPVAPPSVGPTSPGTSTGHNGSGNGHGSTTGLGGGSTGSGLGSVSTGPVGSGTLPTVAAGSGGSGTGQQATSPPQPLATAPVALVGMFNVRDLYLMLAGLGLGVVLLSQVIRLLGVRA